MQLRVVESASGAPNLAATLNAMERFELEKAPQLKGVLTLDSWNASPEHQPVRGGKEPQANRRAGERFRQQAEDGSDQRDQRGDPQGVKALLGARH